LHLDYHQLYDLEIDIYTALQVMTKLK